MSTSSPEKQPPEEDKKATPPKDHLEHDQFLDALGAELRERLKHISEADGLRQLKYLRGDT